MNMTAEESSSGAAGGFKQETLYVDARGHMTGLNRVIATLSTNNDVLTDQAQARQGGQGVIDISMVIQIAG